MKTYSDLMDQIEKVKKEIAVMKDGPHKRDTIKYLANLRRKAEITAAMERKKNSHGSNQSRESAELRRF